MNKKVKISVIVTSVILCISFLSYLGSLDNHYTNFWYVTWKWGILNYSDNVPVQYYSSDKSLQKKMIGKSKEEIKEWFPDLRNYKGSTTYQKEYSKVIERYDDTYYWIGTKN